MKSILNTIGHTPLVKIKNIHPDEHEVGIYAKLEGFNPTGSIKDRIALYMVDRAEKSGLLTKGKTIIEPTSGNTGISLAMIGAHRGYNVKLVMPEEMSMERRQIIKAFGAELILVEPGAWRDAAIKLTKSMVQKDKNLVLLNQFENHDNIQTHYETTGKEIIDQFEKTAKGEIDILVAGVGTGGTIMGIGKRLKEKYSGIKIVGVQPELGEKIEGLKSVKEGYIPPILNLEFINEMIEVEEEEAVEMTKTLAKEEGIFSGPSSGAAMYVALQQAKELPKGNIVVILPDRGEKYLSTKVWR